MTHLEQLGVAEGWAGVERVLSAWGRSPFSCRSLEKTENTYK